MDQLFLQYGMGVYAILFLVIFAETGLVVTPFLPGDSLLFAAGIFSNSKNGNVWIMLGTLTLAPLLGDTVNYHVGKYLGPRIFKSETNKWLNKKHLESTHAFFEKHGPKAIIIARWVPIVRTFAPFVAGMGTMEYKRFFGYSVLGAFIWVWGCVGAGYFLGGIPIVKERFEVAIIIIILVTGAPVLFEMIRGYMKHRKQAAADALTAPAEASQD
ncbi:MAG: VTT domain-containing protein [Fimbriimonadaceae bacterium]|nr:VTT domain-containing protein [Fimbriimonadaceae bacterium]